MTKRTINESNVSKFAEHLTKLEKQRLSDDNVTLDVVTYAVHKNPINDRVYGYDFVACYVDNASRKFFDKNVLSLNGYGELMEKFSHKQDILDEFLGNLEKASYESSTEFEVLKMLKNAPFLGYDYSQQLLIGKSMSKIESISLDRVEHSTKSFDLRQFLDLNRVYAIQLTKNFISTAYTHMIRSLEISISTKGSKELMSDLKESSRSKKFIVNSSICLEIMTDDDVKIIKCSNLENNTLRMHYIILVNGIDHDIYLTDSIDIKTYVQLPEDYTNYCTIRFDRFQFTENSLELHMLVSTNVSSKHDYLVNVDLNHNGTDIDRSYFMSA